jgi:hypothetical protein
LGRTISRTSGWSRIAPTARSLEESWAGKEAAQLDLPGKADHALFQARLEAAGARSGQDWATRFADRIAGFAALSAIQFAALIGALSWSGRISSERFPAAVTAAAYMLIALVATPGVWNRGHRISDHFDRIRPGSSRRFLCCYITALALIAAVYIVANTRAFRPGTGVEHDSLFYLTEFAAFAVVTVLGFITAYLAVTFIYPSLVEVPPAPEVLVWVCELAGTPVTGRLPAGRRRRDPGNRHLDSGMLGLLSCAVAVNELAKGSGPAPAETVKGLIVRIEMAAQELEIYAIERVPRFDLTTRRIAADDGVRLASVARGVKAPLARAIGPQDYAAAASAITRMLLAWSRPGSSELDMLVRDAPGVKKIFLPRRLAGRLWQAALLALAGVALPLLPIYTTNQAAGTSARYALFTAAVVALATGSVPVWETIEKNLQPAS